MIWIPRYDLLLTRHQLDGPAVARLSTARAAMDRPQAPTQPHTNARRRLAVLNEQLRHQPLRRLRPEAERAALPQHAAATTVGFSQGDDAAPSASPSFPTVKEYLARIGLSEVYPPPTRPPPTDETLRTLHAAHQLAVPFENLGARARAAAPCTSHPSVRAVPSSSARGCTERGRRRLPGRAAPVHRAG